MKRAFLLALALMLLLGCSYVVPTHSPVSGTPNLELTEQDLAQLGMSGSCRTEAYETGPYSSLAQYSFCNYTISSLPDTKVIVELSQFSNVTDLNGTYQYSSLHLRSAEGLISENEYGDQSRFYVNNENDYGGQYTDPSISYYSLYFTKNEYLVHVTSGGSKEAEAYIADIGRRILAKFE
ncbi:MAG: hypothetical protein Q7S65_03755 [Nanoarchaeota archaeon]|nr:hypothetical protein [Nanoarchaeota archaeon]